MVVHGCVDGYSRRIMYLEASDNNRSETVCQLLLILQTNLVFQVVSEVIEGQKISVLLSI